MIKRKDFLGRGRRGPYHLPASKRSSLCSGVVKLQTRAIQQEPQPGGEAGGAAACAQRAGVSSRVAGGEERSSRPRGPRERGGAEGGSGTHTRARQPQRHQIDTRRKQDCASGSRALALPQSKKILRRPTGGKVRSAVKCQGPASRSDWPVIEVGWLRVTRSMCTRGGTDDLTSCHPSRRPTPPPPPRSWTCLCSCPRTRPRPRAATRPSPHARPWQCPCSRTSPSPHARRETSKHSSDCLPALASGFDCEFLLSILTMLTLVPL